MNGIEKTRLAPSLASSPSPSPSPNKTPADPAIQGVLPRVLGWDLLRGLCALAVAIYHLLLWQGAAALHSLGSYGVYLFFVLSGASLAYTYGEEAVQRSFSWPSFCGCATCA